ncbi:MAG: hypothetical protein MR911_10840 [Spirochaetia bacterium]|nr:hypothetical protein [Spirochaetia bacterium]
MTNKEVVEEVLRRVSGQTAKQISVLAFYFFNYEMSPEQAGGALRSLARDDKICSSRNENGANVYWLKEDSNL